LRDFDLRLVKDGNAHRRRDETQIVRRLVQLQRALFISARGDCYDGAQRDALEAAAAIRAQEESADRMVLISDDVDLGPCAKRQIAEQMAGGECCYEKILRIVNVGVAAEDRVRTTRKVRLAVDLETVLSSVASIG